MHVTKTRYPTHVTKRECGLPLGPRRLGPNWTTGNGLPWSEFLYLTIIGLPIVQSALLFRTHCVLYSHYEVEFCVKRPVFEIPPLSWLQLSARCTLASFSQLQSSSPLWLHLHFDRATDFTLSKNYRTEFRPILVLQCEYPYKYCRDIVIPGGYS